MRDTLGECSVFQIDAPLLLLGLIFREISRAIEIEPGAPTHYPQQLVHSPLGIEEMNKIEEMLNKVVLPSDK